MKNLLFFTFAILFFINQAHANKLVVTPSNVNNLGETISETYKIKGGDTVYISNGTYGKITLKGLFGQAGNRIKIVLENPDMTWGGSACSFQIENCHYFDFISPEGHFAHINGHRSTSKSSSGMQVHQSDHFTIKGLTIDSTGGFGMQVKTDVDPSDVKHTSWPYYTMDSIHLENIHISNTNNEGFYIGHTGVQRGGVPAGDTISPLRWLTLLNCTAENTGWDGVQVSNSLYNNVHNIQVRNSALLNASGQSTGLTVQNNTSGTFDSVYIYKPVNSGLFVFSVDSTTFSNIIIDQISSDARAVFIDNRPIYFGTKAGKISLINIAIHATGGSNKGIPVYDLNGSLDGAKKAAPAIWRNITYTGYTSKIVDKVPNIMIGGTEGIEPLVVTVAADTTVVNLPTNSVTMHTQVKNAISSNLSYSWKIISGPGQAVLNKSTIATPVVSKLMEGTYLLHLSVTDNNGNKAEDTAAIIVNPQPFAIPGKIEAENYKNTLDINSEPTTDEGGGSDITNLSSGHWVDYQVNVAKSGSYNVTCRAAAPLTEGAMQIRKQDGTVLANFYFHRKRGEQVWQNISEQLKLDSGIQTLRLYVNEHAVKPNVFIRDFKVNWLQFAPVVENNMAANNKKTTTDSLAKQTGTIAVTNLLKAAAAIMKPATGMSIYPNPVSDHFTLAINNEETGKMQVRVSTMQGQVIKMVDLNKSKNSAQLNIATSDLASGSYMVSVINGNTIQTKMMMKL